MLQCYFELSIVRSTFCCHCNRHHFTFSIVYIDLYLNEIWFWMTYILTENCLISIQTTISIHRFMFTYIFPIHFRQLQAHSILCSMNLNGKMHYWIHVKWNRQEFNRWWWISYDKVTWIWNFYLFKWMDTLTLCNDDVILFYD